MGAGNDKRGATGGLAPGLSGSRDDDVSERRLLALSPPSAPTVTIDPAPRWRDWMNATFDRWANRCLPLLVANESGWILRNPFTFTAVWSGDDSTDGLRIEYAVEPPPWRSAVSNFGYGIVTWLVPYLFRTPPGWNLLARGPSNYPKDGAAPLEGLVETDWSVASFTMNWKLTRPDHPVTFEQDEPYCMVVPQRRGDLEAFHPEFGELGDHPDLLELNHQWNQSRHGLRVRKFLGLYSRDFESAIEEWESHYFRGRLPDDREFPEHQTKRRLQPFGDPPGTDGR